MSEDKWLSDALGREASAIHVSDAPVDQLAATAIRTRKRNRLLVTSAVVVAVLAIGGVATVAGTTPPREANSVADAPETGVSFAPPTSPLSTTSAGVSRPDAGNGSSGSTECYYSYSAQTVHERSISFAGDVESIANTSPESGEPLDGYQFVTFRVTEWFSEPLGDSVTVMLIEPPLGDPQPDSEGTLSYSVGSAMLISGERQFPNSDRWVAWTCGFSRPYDEATAATWRR